MRECNYSEYFNIESKALFFSWEILEVKLLLSVKLEELEFGWLITLALGCVGDSEKIPGKLLKGVDFLSGQIW